MLPEIMVLLSAKVVRLVQLTSDGKVPEIRGTLVKENDLRELR